MKQTVLLHSKIILNIGLVAVMSGCATKPESMDEPEAELRPLVANTPDRSSEFEATNASDLSSAIEEPDDALTLPQALALALANNPDLAAFSWDLRIGEARVLQAGLRPNPELGLEVENIFGTGDFRDAQAAETTLQLSQVIELGGKRASRGEVATLARERVLEEYEIRRLEVLADVTEAFVHVVGDQQELALARDATQLTETLLDATQRRVAAGSASALEESRVRVALARRRISEEHAEHELRTARTRLSRLWGVTEPAFSHAEGDLFARQSLPEFTQLEDRINRSPAIGRWVTEKKLRESELKLAQAESKPNLRLVGGIRRMEAPDDEAFVLGVSIPLTLFDRNQGGIAEAEARSFKADAEARALLNRLRVVLFGTYQELLHKETELQSLEEEIVPEARKSLELAQAGFESGRFSQLDLLDAQRTLLEVRLEQIEAAADYHQFIVQIERLIGEPLTPQIDQP